MFCGNCGTQNPDNSPFCAGCGSKLPEAPVTPVRRPSKPSKGPIIAIIAAVVAIAVVLILIFSISTPKSVTKKYIKAMEKGDYEAVLDLVHKDVVEEEIGDKDDVKDYIEEMEEYLDDYGIEYSLKLDEIEDLDEDELEEIQEYYEDEYDLKVKKAKVAIIECEIESDWGDYEDEIEIYLVKIGAKWYIATDL